MYVLHSPYLSIAVLTDSTARSLVVVRKRQDLPRVPRDDASSENGEAHGASHDRRRSQGGRGRGRNRPATQTALPLPGQGDQLRTTNVSDAGSSVHYTHHLFFSAVGRRSGNTTCMTYQDLSLHFSRLRMHSRLRLLCILSTSSPPNRLASRPPISHFISRLHCASIPKSSIITVP